MLDSTPWSFRLFALAGASTTETALANLAAIAREHLPQGYQLEVINLNEAPELARQHQILAVPTLERIYPSPVRRVIGDLSHPESVLEGLGIPRRADGPSPA